MNLKYLAVLAAISLLSLTTACSTPSTTTPSNNVTGESKVDPCAGKKVDPYASKKVDPATGNILAQHRNNPDINAYTKVLDAAITQ